jgi:hypothetical protein
MEQKSAFVGKLASLSPSPAPGAVRKRRGDARPGSGGTAVPLHVTVHYRRSVAACNPAVSHHVPRYMSDQLGRVSIAIGERLGGT